MRIKNRSIVTAIILSLITGGLYGLYWFVCMTDDMALITRDNTTSGVKALIFVFLTCGIYAIYWNYKMGNATAVAIRARGEHSDDKGVLFLILAVFGLGIVNYCLIQDELNKWCNTEF